MRLMMSEFQIAGNATADADVRQVGEHTVTRLSIAHNRRFKKGGETTDKTTYFNVELWDHKFAGEVKKGENVLLKGTMEEEEWTDKENNQRKSLKFRGTVLYRLGERKEGTEAAPAATTPEDQPF